MSPPSTVHNDLNLSQAALLDAHCGKGGVAREAGIGQSG